MNFMNIRFISEERLKKAASMVVAGTIALTSVVGLTGCGQDAEKTVSKTDDENTNVTKTAIIMENGNALIVDVVEEEFFSMEDFRLERSYLLKTTSGDEIVVDFDKFKLISGENSHEKAETIAQALIGEDGQVICYDEVENYGKTR